MKARIISWSTVRGKTDWRTWTCVAVVMQACGFPSVMPNSVQTYGLLPARVVRPWGSPGKNTGVGCHAFLHAVLTKGLWEYCCIGVSWRWVGIEGPKVPGNSKFLLFWSQQGYVWSKELIANQWSVIILWMNEVTEVNKNLRSKRKQHARVEDVQTSAKQLLVRKLRHRSLCGREFP